MQDYLLADSAFYPVSALNRRSASLTLTQLKDHSAMSIELGCRGEPGAVFLVSSPRQFLYGAQGAGLVTSARILTDLHRLESGGRGHSITWVDRAGERPDRVRHFPSRGRGPDPARTLQQAGLLVFTDQVSLAAAPGTRHCNATAGQLPCLLQGCYTPQQGSN